MKTILLLLLMPSILLSAQPKLVGTLGFSGTQDGGAIFRYDLPGSSPGILHSFDNQSPHSPSAGVCKGDGAWLYGTTGQGGNNNAGTFYRIQQNGTGFTKLYDFATPSSFRSIPFFHTDDIVYFRDIATIRKYNTTNGTFSSISANAPIQSRNLHIDIDDWMYFVELGFPARLVKIKTDGSSWTLLHDFVAATEGDLGEAGVTEIAGDTLFGVNRFGGTNNGGTLYSIKKDGTSFIVHHQFDSATGINPDSKLVFLDGKLYGTTLSGGSFNRGVLFCINQDGTNYRVLRHFEMAFGYSEAPSGNIAISSNGRIFGAFATFTFTTNFYRLYKIDTSGANFEPIFVGDPLYPQRINGDNNQDLLLLSNETIFFTTIFSGRNDGGVLNTCDTTGTGNDLYHFGHSANGFRPLPGIIKASDGKLYGATTIGGASGNGVVYAMNADGTGYTKLHEFTDAQGYEPSGKLLEASDGKLYGACRHGGSSGLGCLYRVNKNGTGFEIIYNYSGATAGYSPVGGLIEDGSGVLYGVNFWATGSVFKINKNGTGYTELKVFASGGSELHFPYNGLTLRSGYLYGACGYGGAGNTGGIFRIKTDGSSYAVLHEFNGTTEGGLPVGTPIIASNGKLYGSAAMGGNNNGGTLFRLDTNGANFTILRHLSPTDGTDPWTAMIQASDGAIYGSTQIGGSNGSGTLVKMNLDGSGFTVLKNFGNATEGQGVHSLIDLNGSFVTLPVRLLTFDAYKRAETILLSWKTASETNSSHFDVERSADGNRFTSIGRVTAAGFQSLPSTYSFTDAQPLAGTNYYRLKQVDRDAAFSYSKTVAVNMKASIRLAPNPARDKLVVTLSNSNYLSLRIIDASGKIVWQQQGIPNRTVTIDVQRLPRGRYVLQLIGSDVEQHSFIKQ